MNAHHKTADRPKSYLSGAATSDSLIRRLAAGAVIGAGALGIPEIILVIVTLAGGRYQPHRRSGIETDMWLLCAVYPVGAAMAGALGVGFGRLVHRTWQSVLLGFASAVPMFALMSLTDDPHGPRPYHVSWLFTVALSMLLGGTTGAMIFRGVRSSRWTRRGRQYPRAHPTAGAADQKT